MLLPLTRTRVGIENIAIVRYRILLLLYYLLPLRGGVSSGIESIAGNIIFTRSGISKEGFNSSKVVYNVK